ncbi:MAG: hypothetical protein K8T10_03005, partial [Candidatus Eremiobacteraeota bacterium]|nr:hypothetical protein [Candidatus Eremiobacteraeota bacterium]
MKISDKKRESVVNKHGVGIQTIKGCFIGEFEPQRFEDFLIALSLTSDHGETSTRLRRIMEYSGDLFDVASAIEILRFLVLNGLVIVNAPDGGLDSMTDSAAEGLEIANIDITPRQDIVSFVEIVPWSKEHSIELMKKILMFTPVYREIKLIIDRPISEKDLERKLHAAYGDAISAPCPTIDMFKNYGLLECYRPGYFEGDMMLYFRMKKVDEIGSVSGTEHWIPKVPEKRIAQEDPCSNMVDVVRGSPGRSPKVSLNINININLPFPAEEIGNVELERLRNTIAKIKTEIEKTGLYSESIVYRFKGIINSILFRKSG